MLNDKSFLRNVPSEIAIEKRVLLDAISFSIEAIFLSYKNIKNSAVNVGFDVKEMNYDEMYLLNIHARSIIDYGHEFLEYLTLLLEKHQEEAFRLNITPVSKFVIQEIKKYIDENRAISEIRNYRDHLRSLIKNISNQKSKAVPLHGSVSYTFLSGKNLKNIENVFLLAVISGFSGQSDVHFETCDPFGEDLKKRGPLKFPVDQFTLHSYGKGASNIHRFNLSIFVEKTILIMKYFDKDFRDYFNNEKMARTYSNNASSKKTDYRTRVFAVLMEASLDGYMKNK